MGWIRFKQRKDADIEALQSAFKLLDIAEWEGKLDKNNIDRVWHIGDKRLFKFFHDAHGADYKRGAQILQVQWRRRISSAKDYPSWMFRLLSQEQCLEVLRGVWQADGDSSTRMSTIYTSSAEVRDRICQLGLHAGQAVRFHRQFSCGSVRGYRVGEKHYSVKEGQHVLSPADQEKHKIQATRDGWRVSFCGHNSHAARPILLLRDITEAEDESESSKDEDVFAFVVDHQDHLVFAQRASSGLYYNNLTNMSEDVVTKASRPIIVCDSSF